MHILSDINAHSCREVFCINTKFINRSLKKANYLSTVVTGCIVYKGDSRLEFSMHIAVWRRAFGVILSLKELARWRSQAMLLS